MKSKNNSALEEDGLHYLNNLQKIVIYKWNTLVAVNGRDGEENLAGFSIPTYHKTEKM